MNIILTGATGILGSHILYELLYCYLQKKLNGKVYVIIRSNQYSAQRRLLNVLKHSEKPDYLNNFTIEEFLPFIEVIDSNLEDLCEATLEKHINDKCYFIHTAACTNLANNKDVETELYNSNYITTLKLIRTAKKWLQKFIFVSTAYSCGVQEGTIRDDFLSLQCGEYRNPYEKVKAKVERELVTQCEQENIEWQIVRPSIICGRLLEAPLFFTSKFNVFYSYLQFFHKIMASPMKYLSLRICADPTSYVNVVSVDQVAKTIISCFSNSEIQQLNIVGDDINTHYVIQELLSIVAYENFELVDKIPSQKNALEKIYYERPHAIFGKYANSPKLFYEKNRAIGQHIEILDIKNQLRHLSEFAISRGFQSCDW